MKLNEKIRNIRTNNNLTQDEFANIINVSRSSIALYERGLRKPDINIIHTISNYFEIPIDEFYEEYIKESKKNNKLKISLLFLFSVIILIFALLVNDIHKIKDEYGYNIYNDTLKVENSSDICIVKINDLINKNNKERIYKITVIDYLKKNFEDEKYNFDKLRIKDFELNSNNIFLIFNNINKFDYEVEKFNYNCDLVVDHKQFVEELKGYDESKAYNDQDGKCGKVINYYLDIINKK